MLRQFISVSLLFVVPFLSGCVSRTQTGANVVNVTDTDFSKIKTYKRGEACLKNILGFFYWDDYLLTSAVKTGGIKRVRFVESEVRSWIVFTKMCTIVYGE